ncbi:MAG: hypothetical protein Q9226_002694 [Calogaya cf. arnoldii]
MAKKPIKSKLADAWQQLLVRLKLKEEKKEKKEKNFVPPSPVTQRHINCRSRNHHLEEESASTWDNGQASYSKHSLNPTLAIDFTGADSGQEDNNSQEEDNASTAQSISVDSPGCNTVVTSTSEALRRSDAFSDMAMQKPLDEIPDQDKDRVIKILRRDLRQERNGMKSLEDARRELEGEKQDLSLRLVAAYQDDSGRLATATRIIKHQLREEKESKARSYSLTSLPSAGAVMHNSFAIAAHSTYLDVKAPTLEKDRFARDAVKHDRRAIVEGEFNFWELDRDEAYSAFKNAQRIEGCGVNTGRPGPNSRRSQHL